MIARVGRCRRPGQRCSPGTAASTSRLWAAEYGSAQRPDELAWLLSYSPYHHVRPGVVYPPVLLATFEEDTRVDPIHARKMCAERQHVAARADRPVVLRREADAGLG